ncbi:hypothetical protein EG329_008993 [Mollisiaceae sp. DMI_Dod_QoI]|nr:hypothetical protein EG329_008993 [Helotiales sp. DMI_Dod_QoI]
MDYGVSSTTPSSSHSSETEPAGMTIPVLALAREDEESLGIHLPTDVGFNTRDGFDRFGNDPRLLDPAMIGQVIDEFLNMVPAPSHRASNEDTQDTPAETSEPDNTSVPGLSSILDQIIKGSRRSPAPTSYSPDIDNALVASIFQASHEEVSLAAAPLWKTTEILQRYGFSFNGAILTGLISQKYTPQNFDKAFSNLLVQSDIEIYLLQMAFFPFGLTREFTSLSRNLNLAPSFTYRMHGKYPNGLARRIFRQHADINIDSHRSKGKAPMAEPSVSYHLWFYLPIVDFHNSGMSDLDLNNPIYQYLLDRSGRLGVHLPNLGIHISEDYAVFYLSYNCTSRKTTLFLTASATSETRFNDICQMSSELDLRGDPFAFISCALSEIVNEWSLYSEKYLDSLRNTETWVLSLQEEMDQEQINKAKGLILELRKLRPFQAYQINSCKCLLTIARDSIEEHNTARDFLDIPEPAFSRVDKNLRTIASWINPIEMALKSDLDRIDSCISTLSYLFSIRYDRAIDVNTDTMRRIAESAQDENYTMRQIAKSTKLDSEAMKTIAFLTMLYLPATFVATFFSMGMFNFDFNDAWGGIRISPQWWIYFLVTLPLTIGTYFTFRIVYKREQENISRDTPPIEKNSQP